MTNGQFRRMGAFVGTVATVVVADRIARRRSTDVVEAIGKSFSSSLGAMTGSPLREGRENETLAQYQRGGKGSVNIQAAGNVNVWQQGYERANELFPLAHIATEPRRHAHRSIYYWALSLFPQVTTPYVVDWASIAEQLSGVSAADDMELVGEIIAELWDRNGL